MPIIFEKQIDTAKKLAVWHITESDTELFNLSKYIINPLFSEKRNRELAVSVILLNMLIGFNAHKNLTKDKFGKPFLNNSNISVSFSHSKQMVACIIDAEGQPVGIDIERQRESIKTVAHKFITPTDTSTFSNLMHYHLIWGGKEVLYKIYAKKELDFLAHLTVCYNTTHGIGHIHKNNLTTQHHLCFDAIGDYVLVWGY